MAIEKQTRKRPACGVDYFSTMHVNNYGEDNRGKPIQSALTFFRMGSGERKDQVWVIAQYTGDVTNPNEGGDPAQTVNVYLSLDKLKAMLADLEASPDET